MNRIRRFALAGVAAASLASLSLVAAAQTGQVFQDKSNGFSIAMAGDWRAITYSDAVGRRKTEFIYRDRSQGLLRVGRDSLDGRTVIQAAHDELAGVRTYRQGFELSSDEAFGGGALDGVRLCYYYVDGGRRTAEADYFLKDGDHVWELRFTGKRGVLDLVRNLTDQMARSFKPL